MIFDNAERHRFEQEEDAKLVFASYRLREGVYALVHVEADPELRGTGAAGRFMAALIAYARENQLKLQPFCSYARAWFQRHPEAVQDTLP
jgi:predicted GNAT family acetyltransferase